MLHKVGYNDKYNVFYIKNTLLYAATATTTINNNNKLKQMQARH